MRNTAYRPSTPAIATYTIGLETTITTYKNRSAAQTAARHKLSFLKCQESDGSGGN